LGAKFVYENDDLTWTQVANASGVNEPIVNIRGQKAKKLAGVDASKAAMADEDNGCGLLFYTYIK